MESLNILIHFSTLYHIILCLYDVFIIMDGGDWRDNKPDSGNRL